VPDIDIGGATLHYATSGTGEPILLIPGLGLDHSYYRFGIPLLSRHLQVLAVDPRGIGQSAPVRCVDGPQEDALNALDGVLDDPQEKQAALDANAADLSTVELEDVNAALVRLKDAVWAVGHDRLRTA